jgi:alpha/beta superfamily hydrolase
MKERQATFASGGLKLEGLLVMPEDSRPARAGVVCHPHPLYGGSMYNNVVDAVLEAMWKLGWATLRFNFRGVGQSEGEHGDGAGEAEDAAAAVRFLGEQTGLSASSLALAGYSFGAMAAAAAAPGIANLGALTLIALPLRMADAAALKGFAGPVILLAGDQDMYCPAVQLEALQRDLGARAQIRIIEGADHFFGGFEEDLAAAAESMLKAIA